MKKTACLLALCLLTAAGAQAQSRIATVDLKKTFDSYWKTKQADANIKDLAAELDKTRKSMVDDYQKRNEDYKKLLDAANDQAVAAEQREKRKKDAESALLEIKQIENDVAQFDRTSRTRLAEQQRRMRDSILKEIRDVINAKAKTKAYNLVVDTAAESINATPITLYFTTENDITDEVVAQLNVNAPPASSLTAPAAAPDPKKK
jgi:outer membrane protein